MVIHILRFSNPNFKGGGEMMSDQKKEVAEVSPAELDDNELSAEIVRIELKIKENEEAIKRLEGFIECIKKLRK
jgi:hypothetical protein